MGTKNKKRKIKSLSEQLVFSYAFIILIPIILLVGVAAFSMQRSQTNSVLAQTKESADETVARINGLIDTVIKLDTLVEIRTELLRRLTLSNDQTWLDYDEINKFVEDVTEIERILFLSDQIYSVNIFVNNPSVPERWPIIYSRDRLDEVPQTWSFNYTSPIKLTGGNYQTYPLLATYTKPIYYLGNETGILQISINMNTIFPELYYQNSLKEDYFYLLEEGEVLPISPESNDRKVNESVLDKAITSALNAESDSGIIHINRPFNNYYIIYNRFGKSPEFLYLKVAPLYYLNNIFLIYFIGGLAVGLIIFLIVVLLTNRTTVKRTKNLTNLMNALSEVAKGNFYAEPNNITGDSYEALEGLRAFYKLKKELTSSIDKITKQQELIADTEIKAMQNQINVHFIFNALESIKMMAMIHEDHEIEKSAALLGELLRYCLRWKDKFVPLSDELEYCKGYVDLMNIRNDFQVKLELDIDDYLIDSLIPKMIIQPVIENAFRHSFEVTGTDGKVRVWTEDKGEEFFYIAVSNTGVKFDEKKIEELLNYLKEGVPEKKQKSGKIGMKNIQERLFLIYSSSYKIKIQKSEKETIIKIPIKKEGNYNEDLSR